MLNTKNMPKISIITICLNSEKTIEHTIQSIINQKYLNLEYLIIDGGSTDETLKIIEKYQHDIDYFVSEKDKGISDAFNKGIEKANGDLIGIVSADDYLPEGSLETIAETWKDNQDVDVIYGNSIVFGLGSKKRFVVKPDKDFRAIWKRQPLKHSAMYITRKAYLKFGKYDIKYHLAMDYELTLRYYLEGARFIYIDKVVGAFRVGGINNQYFMKTIAEVRDISIYHGYSQTKAYLWFFIKSIRCYIRSQLYKFHLFPLINMYRSFSPRFKKYDKY